MRPWVSLDVETSGTLPEYALQPWRFKQGKAWITTIAVTRKTEAGELKSTGLVYPLPLQIKGILDKLAEMKARVVGWNNTFDISWLIAYGLQAEVDALMWIDAMRLKRHVHVVPTFQGDGTDKLKDAVAERWPELAGYEEGVDYHNQDPVYLENVVLPYNIVDTERTLLLGLDYWECLTEKQQQCALTESYCLPMVARANLDGMRIDQDAVKVLDQTLSEKADRLEAELAQHGVTETVVRSPKQLANKLFKEWGLPPIKYGKPNKKTGEILGSTDKETIEELSPLDERVATIGDWRQTLNARGKFVGSLIESVRYNGDGLSHPQAIVFGTYSRRFTYSSKQGKGAKEKHVGFALHQMITRVGGKTDKRFRNCILAPDADELAPEGYDIVEFDAVGQEFRWMAIHTGDETMLSLCQPGEDAHAFMFSQISGADYREILKLVEAADKAAKEGRQLGKTANFALQYRTGAKKFRVMALIQYSTRLSLEQATKIHGTYRRSYKKVPIWWDKQIAIGRRLGYAETLAGARVQVEGNWSNPNLKWFMESTMVNYPIQGTGGEQKYLAFRVLSNILPKYGARLAWDLHDGIYFYCPKSKSRAFAAEAIELLDNLPYERAWGFKSPIPLPWECKAGPSWGTLKDVAP